MITLDLTLKENQFGGGSYRCQPYRVKRGFSMCRYDFDSFFSIPKDAKNIRLELTKTANPDAYLMEQKTNCAALAFGGSYNELVTTLDGFKANAYGSQASTVKRLLADGYKYIRVTHD